MKKKNKGLYTIPRIFIEVIRVNPAVFVLQYSLSIIASILLGLFIRQLQITFDSIVHLIAGQTPNNFRSAAWSLLLIFMYKFGSEGLEIVNGYLGNAYYSRCAAHFLRLYNDRIGRVRAITFEDEKKLALFNKALEGAVSGRGMLHVVMDVFTMYVPYLITVGIFLARQDTLLLLIFVLISLPIILTNQIKKHYNVKLQDSATNPRRRKEEYASYFVNQKYYKEMRVRNLFDFFYKKYETARTELNQFFFAYNKKAIVISLITKIITLGGFLTVLFLLINRMLSGIISVGAFGAIFYSLDDVYSMLEEALVTRIAEYYAKVPLIKAFIRLLNEEDFVQDDTSDAHSFTNMTLENVSFTYPNSNAPAIQNVDLSIRKKDKIAVVGYNGSGKSTLAKILVGLYAPTSGSIVIGQQCASCASPKMASVLFQNFNRYKDSVYNNVRISDLGKHIEAKESYEEVADLLGNVGLTGFGLLNEDLSLDVLCAREFGGIDLSGGQWQRIATARMLYRNRDFVILDEPTSEIDPLSEHLLFELFEKELKEKTAIIITHRMTSIHFCNKILVMKDGNVIAEGTHETLMKICPHYFQLYNTLQEKYITPDTEAAFSS